MIMFLIVLFLIESKNFLSISRFVNDIFVSLEMSIEELELVDELPKNWDEFEASYGIDDDEVDGFDVSWFTFVRLT
jgi:hypothetical protein